MGNKWGLALVCVVAIAAQRAAAFDISSCDQTVGYKDTGSLTADLVCPPSSHGVTLGDGATLDMNGHSIEVPDGWGIWCIAETKCTVNGAGSGGESAEIRGGSAGIYLQRGARLTASDVAIHDCHIGIQAEDWNNGRTGAGARLTNVLVTGSEGAGLQVGRLKLENVTVDGNPGTGIMGLSTSTIKAEGLTVTGNAFSAGCQDYGCSGIEIGQIKGNAVVVSGNAGIGIHAERATLRYSTVTDNVRAGVLKDLVTGRRPRLLRSTCGTSLGWGSQSLVHWGVCTFDD